VAAQWPSNQRRRERPGGVGVGDGRPACVLLGLWLLYLLSFTNMYSLRSSLIDAGLVLDMYVESVVAASIKSGQR
jgi:hypothetical protein